MSTQKPKWLLTQLEKALDNLLGASLWIMALSLTVVTLMRYTVGYGATWLNDIAIYSMASMCLLGLSSTFQHNRHVRLDIVYTKMSKTAQVWVNLCGNLLLLLPFCVYLIISSTEYVSRSWQLLEGSGEAAGLGGLYLIKTMLIVGPGLLVIQSLRQSWQLLQQVISLQKTPTL